jgi:outer membrane lipoprotein-sorting protein
MKPSHARVAVLLVPLLSACAGRIPLPEAYRAADAAALVARMETARAAASAYSAEARLTYFGAEGRLKGTASLLVARPNRLRYELEGPHGGVLMAVAVDGATLTALDMRTSRFLTGPATPHNLDTVLNLVPLGEGIEAWVRLLFGEVRVPQDATLAYDDRRGVFVLTWEAAGRAVTLRVDPASARAREAEICEGGEVASRVEVSERDASGLPVALRLQAPAARADVEVRLRDVTLEPEVGAGVFVLPAPAGVATVPLPP